MVTDVENNSRIVKSSILLVKFLFSIYHATCQNSDTGERYVYFGKRKHVKAYVVLLIECELWYSSPLLVCQFVEYLQTHM